MTKKGNSTAQGLIEALMRIRSLKWRQSPIVGLKSSEMMVLFCIKKRKKPETSGMKVSEISSALRVASPTVTQLINGLETNGFVERKIDQEDRRAVRVQLTDKGEQIIEKASEAFFDSINGLVDYLGEEDSNKFKELLAKTYQYFNEVRRVKL